MAHNLTLLEAFFPERDSDQNIERREHGHIFITEDVVSQQRASS